MQRLSTMAFSGRPRKITTNLERFSEFEELFQSHWNRVCLVTYRLVGDWAEAEDLALEAFLQLYRRPPQQLDNLGGWLYRVATNLGLNALRAGKRRQGYEERAGVIMLENDAPGDPAQEAERIQEQEQVRLALARMQPREAQLLVLRHSGLSYAELAEALDLNPASIGTLLVRAERAFEKIYRDSGATHLEGEVEDASQ